MIIEFTPDLKEQNIYANGNELSRIMGMDRDEQDNKINTWQDSEKRHVVKFDKPVLVTDNYRISQLSPVLRDTTFALYASKKKKIIYDQTSMNFDQGTYPSVWGPSIDTLVLCRAIKQLKREKKLEEFKTAAEIGSGSGFISKYILETNPQLEKMSLVDINPEARDCAKDKILDPRMKARTNTGMEYLKDRKFDLVICNPPYIPRMKTIEDNPYEGTGLITGLIAKSKEYLTPNGILVLNVSSICEKKTLETLKETNVIYEKIDQLEVPLKVFDVLNNPKWMNYLKENSMLEKNSHDGYDYWQMLNIYAIIPKTRTKGFQAGQFTL